MKNLRKLVIASFMLVIAFVAVVSSTYAWFTTSSEAKVNEITIGVVDADAALLISETGETDTWKSNVDINSADFQGLFTPVTIVNGDEFGTFKKLGLHSGQSGDADNGKFEYVAVDNLYGAASDEATGYLAFDLYFQITIGNDNSWDEYKLQMDLTDLHAFIKQTVQNGEVDNYGASENNSKNAAALSSFRLAVATYNYTNQKWELGELYEDSYAASNPTTGQYGTGDQFENTNSFMRLYLEDHASNVNLVNAPAENTTNYTMANPNTTVYGETEAINASNAEYDLVLSEAMMRNVGLKVGSDSTQLTSGLKQGYLKLRIYVWMEGWDGDCVNAAAGSHYTFGLTFKVTK